ncbi:MAG: response regulator [Spirochaetia bacterium]|nr:response regulator [Spirochaetia bacterium]
MNVLIVEDDAISRKMIEMLMKPIANEYDLAEDGKIAQYLFNKYIDTGNRYDLVLLDIMLPKMDGQTLLQKFRKKEKEKGIQGKSSCKIIMVSALGDAGNIMEAFKNQCDGYLTKPYNKRNLIEELKKLELIS